MKTEEGTGYVGTTPESVLEFSLHGSQSSQYGIGRDKEWDRIMWLTCGASC